MPYTSDKYNLIFDFDGTICLYEQFINKSFIESLFQFSSLDSIDKFIQKYSNLTSDYDFINNYIKCEYRTEVIGKFVSMNIQQTSSKKIDLIIKDIIIKLYKKYNLFIITGRDYFSTINALKINNIEQYFIDVVCSNETTFSKPNSHKGQLLLDKYKLNKKDSVYIGDQKTDAEFAENLSIKFIGANWIHNIYYGEHLYCDDIKQLEHYINKLFE